MSQKQAIAFDKNFITIPSSSPLRPENFISLYAFCLSFVFLFLIFCVYFPLFANLYHSCKFAVFDSLKPLEKC